MKLTASQEKTLNAYRNHPSDDFIGTGCFRKELGKLAHPNTVDKLVKLGLLEKHPRFYSHRAAVK